MIIISRRGLLGASVIGGLGLVVPAFARSGLAPPTGSWGLSRIIERELGDGSFITVQRDWKLSFVQIGQGVQINGHQTGVDVAAPERLAALAQLEKERIVGDLFPLTLSSAGLIEAAAAGSAEAGSAAGESADQQVRRAVVIAEQMFQARDVNLAQQEQARMFMNQLQNTAQPLLETLPPDLLYPRGGTSEAIQSVNLPNGEQGEFKLEYSARAQPNSGWLDQAERLITTTIGSSSRTSRESWRLAGV
jgi:hypothetical protein